MRRIFPPMLILGLLCLVVGGVAGCGGTESGTTQISEKFAPDPELNAKASKSAKPGRSPR